MGEGWEGWYCKRSRQMRHEPGKGVGRGGGLDWAEKEGFRGAGDV